MFAFQSKVHFRLRSHTTEKYNLEPSKYWNDFYKSKANFFRDRKWLPREFPELLGLTESDVSSMGQFCCCCSRLDFGYTRLGSVSSLK